MKDKVSGKEFAWYVFGGLFAVAGITLMIFGIIGHHMNVPLDNNFIKKAEEALISAIKAPFDFRIWGIILLLLGVIIISITLAYNAKKTDREVEKTIRRQQRINAGVEQKLEVKSAVEIIEEKPAIDVEPVKENK